MWVDLQLKTIYSAIQKYQEQTSGLHWDNVNGANIKTESETSVWNGYVATKVRYCILLEVFKCLNICSGKHGYVALLQQGMGLPLPNSQLSQCLV